MLGADGVHHRAHVVHALLERRQRGRAARGPTGRCRACRRGSAARRTRGARGSAPCVGSSHWYSRCEIQPGTTTRSRGPVAHHLVGDAQVAGSCVARLGRHDPNVLGWHPPSPCGSSSSASATSAARPRPRASCARCVRAEGLEDAIELDSAGTGGWHVGEPPDARATAAAQARGIALTGAARQVTPRGLRALRPPARDGPARTCATCAASRPDDEAAAARPGCCASSTRAPERTAISPCPTPTTAASAASRTCSTSSRPPAAGCSPSCAPRGGCDAPARGERRHPGVRGLDQRGLVGRARGRAPGVREDPARRGPERVRHRGAVPALAGRAGRGPAAGRDRRGRRLPRARVDRRGPARAARRRGARPRARRAARRRGRTGVGAPWPLHIGELRPAPTSPLGTWPAFYAERRLRPTLRMAVDRGTLAPSGARAVERVCERIDELAGPPEPPARLHGDLWGGNVLAGADGRAWLVDPVAYGGHREVDLAMLRLFGSPGERVFAGLRRGASAGATATRSGWRSGSSSRCSCTPSSSAAATARRSSPPRVASSRR